MEKQVKRFVFNEREYLAQKHLYDCVSCRKPSWGTIHEFRTASVLCPECRARRERAQYVDLPETSDWVTTYRKEEEVEVAFFPTQLHVAVNPCKVSSKALYGGRTPEEILVYQEEKQQRNFGVPAHKIDPRWAKLLTL